MSAPILDVPRPEPLTETEYAEASRENDALPPDGIFCETCGKPLSYSGRGRKPRYCDEHKPSRASSSPRSGTRKRTWKDALSVEQNLTDSLQVIAGGLLFLPPETPLNADGAALYQFGPRIAHELVVLAEQDQRLRRMLIKLAAPGKYGPLVFACGSLLLAIAANHGLLPAPFAQAVAQNMSGGETS